MIETFDFELTLVFSYARVERVCMSIKMGGTAVAHKVVLACTICQSRNYTSEKNKEAQVKRIEIKKFCKYCNRHTLHRETK